MGKIFHGDADGAETGESGAVKCALLRQFKFGLHWRLAWGRDGDPPW